METEIRLENIFTLASLFISELFSEMFKLS